MSAIDREALEQEILSRIQTLVQEAESQRRPLEVDPGRSELFQLFAQAAAADCVGEDAQPDLSADGLCASLAKAWGLKSAAEMSVREQTALSAEQLARMRSLWSVMRMWMEWTYAWQRWPEFHGVSD